MRIDRFFQVKSFEACFDHPEQCTLTMREDPVEHGNGNCHDSTIKAPLALLMSMGMPGNIALINNSSVMCFLELQGRMFKPQSKEEDVLICSSLSTTVDVPINGDVRQPRAKHRIILETPCRGNPAYEPSALRYHFTLALAEGSFAAFSSELRESRRWFKVRMHFK